MIDNLGDYLKFLRKNIQEKKTIKKITSELNISPQYLNDLENNKRAPSGELLNKFIKLYKLEQEEKIKLYDLAAISYKKKKVPSDIATFIIENEEVKNKIRNMMQDYTKEEKENL